MTKSKVYGDLRPMFGPSEPLDLERHVAHARSRKGGTPPGMWEYVRLLAGLLESAEAEQQ